MPALRKLEIVSWLKARQAKWQRHRLQSSIAAHAALRLLRPVHRLRVCRADLRVDLGAVPEAVSRPCGVRAIAGPCRVHGWHGGPPRRSGTLLRAPRQSVARLRAGRSDDWPARA